MKPVNMISRFQAVLHIRSPLTPRRKNSKKTLKPPALRFSKCRSITPAPGPVGVAARGDEESSAAASKEDMERAPARRRRARRTPAARLLMLFTLLPSPESFIVGCASSNRGEAVAAGLAGGTADDALVGCWCRVDERARVCCGRMNASPKVDEKHSDDIAAVVLMLSDFLLSMNRGRPMNSKSAVKDCW